MGIKDCITIDIPTMEDIRGTLAVIEGIIIIIYLELNACTTSTIFHPVPPAQATVIKQIYIDGIDSPDVLYRHEHICTSHVDENGIVPLIRKVEKAVKTLHETLDRFATRTWTIDGAKELDKD